MEGLTTSLFLSISALYFVFSFVKGELSADECLKLGFNRANLLCSSCDLLQKYELYPLKDNCTLCCIAPDTDTDKATVKKYPKATLDVCG